ncbi:MAG: YciI family protein [Kofleriaceae bacterium]
MKLGLVLAFLIPACAAPRPAPSTPAPASPASPAAASASPAAAGYDEALATRLGGDDYGMASYVLAILKRGPRADLAPEEAARLQRAHLANIFRLADEGVLVIAGPFLDDGAMRGIYIFKVATVEEARALTATDPAIQAGSLEMELHPWYGSAALQEVNRLHRQIQRKSVLE